MSVALNENEKRVFTKILCRLIRADGNFDVNEIHFLGDYAKRYEIPIEEIRAIIRISATDDVVAEAANIREHSKAVELVKEMCLLANSDDNFADQELDFILQITDQINIDLETIIKINNQLLLPEQEDGQFELPQNNDSASTENNVEFCFAQPNISSLKQGVFHIPEFRDAPRSKFSEKLKSLSNLRGISV